MKDEPSSAIGFVDVLIGAMSSAILLFMAQAAVPPAKPGFGRGSGYIRIEGVPSTQSDGLNLAVRFRIDGQVKSGPELFRAGERRLSLSSADGELEFEIAFGENPRFGERDELLVYVHDLGNGPRKESSASLRVTITNKGTQQIDPPPTVNTLDFDHPILIVPLAHVSGQRTGITPKWRRP